MCICARSNFEGSVLDYINNYKKMSITEGYRSQLCEIHLQEVPELVCQGRSEAVDFSVALEAILKRLKIVVYLSSCQGDKSKLVRYSPQARAARKNVQ